MFHVKHPQTIHNLRPMNPSEAAPTTPSVLTRSGRTRGRRSLLAAVAVLVLLATGCATISSPDGWAAPVADRGLVFVHDDDGGLVAVRLLDEGLQEVWRFPSESDDLDFKAIYATPILDGGALYLVAYDGIVIALDSANGRPLTSWPGPVDVGDTIIATPAFDGQNLLVATDGGRVVTIDVSNGTITGELLSGGGRLWSSPVSDARSVYVGDFDQSRITAIDRANGSERWSLDLNGGVLGSLTLDGQLLFAGSVGRSLYALNVDTGAERWRFDGDGWFAGRPLVAGDIVYAATLGGSVYAINIARGTERWRFTNGDEEFRSQPVLVGGTLVVASRDGLLIGLNPSTGDLLWEQSPDAGRFFADPLVLDSDILYVSDQGDLVRVSPRDGAFQLLSMDQ